MVKSNRERPSVPNYHHMMASVIHWTNTSTRTVQINLTIIISKPVFHPDSQLLPDQLDQGMLGKRNYYSKTKMLFQATSEGK